MAQIQPIFPVPRNYNDAMRMVSFYETMARQTRRRAEEYLELERGRKARKERYRKASKYARDLLQHDHTATLCHTYCRRNGIDIFTAERLFETFRPQYEAEFRQKRNAAIVKMKRRGRSTQQIAEHWNLHPATVRKIINEKTRQ